MANRKFRSNELAAICFLATLVAIVVLTATGAVVMVAGEYGSEENVAKANSALGFIAAAITGLVGVIGTFRPKGDIPNPEEPPNEPDG